ncbi:Outer membrane protein [Gammaproteobacteria bacterium]
MKKLLVVSAIAALGLTSVAFAGGLPEEMPAVPAAVSSDTGIYLGLQGGLGLTNWKNYDGATNDNSGGYGNVSNDSGFVGRVFAGYDINRYFAIEAGYSYFFNKANTEWNTTYNINKIKTQAIDAYFKGKLPVVESFDLYAKLGAGYLMTQNNPAANNYAGGNNNNINVAFGAGADYYITPNVIANLEWTRIAGSQKVTSEKFIPNTDAFMIGLRYKFDV